MPKKEYTSANREPQKASQTRRSRRKERPSEPQSESYFSSVLQNLGNDGLQALIEGHKLQAKLRVSQSGDPQEKEADRVADQVMQGPSSGPKGSTNIVDSIMAKASSTGAQSVSHSQLSGLESGGKPMDQSSRQFFENRFGADFGNVRIHSGHRASGLTGSINARAVTYGNHIAFNQGEYQPSTTQGKKLIAHELTHVVQQGKAGQRSVDRAEKDEAENYDGKLSAILLTAKKFVTVNGETVTFLKTKKEDRRYTIGRLVNYKNQTAIAVSQSSKPVQEFEKSSEWAKEISAKDEAERNDLIDNLARLDFKDRRQTILDDRGITYEEQKDSEKLAGYISILEAAHLPTTEYESLRKKAQKEETQNTDNKANTDTQQYRKELRLKLIASVIENYSGTRRNRNADLGRFDAEILHNSSLHVDPKLMGDLFEYWYTQQDGEIDREDLKGFDRSNPARTLARSKQIDFRDKSGKIVRKADGILKLADNNTLVEIKAVTGKPTDKHIDQMKDYAYVLRFFKKDWYHQKNGDIEKFKKMNMRYVFSTEKTALAWLPELLDKFDLIDGELQVYVGTRSLEINNNQKKDK